MTVDVSRVLPVHSTEYRTQAVNLQPPAGATSWVIPVVKDYQGLASEILIFNESADILKFWDLPEGRGIPMPLASHTISQLEGWFDFIYIESPNAFNLTARLTFAKLSEVRLA